MMELSEQALAFYLKEDIPSFDLTTLAMGIGEKEGHLCISAREEGILCGSEEVKRVCERLALHVTKILPSGAKIQKGDEVFCATGKAKGLHQVWKVCANLLENMSGIATRTHTMVQAAGNVKVVATRKIMPGTRDLSTKAILSGGGYPHRLGLSESILIFDAHKVFVDRSTWIPLLQHIKETHLEKKVMVEVANEDEALHSALHVDVLQCDKFSLETLKAVVPKLKKTNPYLIISAAGGIDEGNVATYAKTGVDLLVSSAMYWGKPLDFGVSITPR